MDFAFEDVWSLQDIAELLLRRLDVRDLTSLRAASKLLKAAVDRWGIERLVIRDDAEGEYDDYSKLPARFPVVRWLIVRTISDRTLSTLAAFASKGRLLCVEYDECEVFEQDICTMPSMPVESLIVRDCEFGTQHALDILCVQLHPANSVRIDGVQLRVVGDDLLIIGNEQQQFAARLGASRKQCVIPGVTAGPMASVVAEAQKASIVSMAFTYNIHLSPQKPLWKSPTALARMQDTLHSLDLSGNALALDNMHLLFYEGKFHKLAKLRLRDCSLTESHMEIISQATSCVSLRHLDLGQNRLGTPIATYYLASSTQLTSQLTYLSLADQEETTEDWLYGLALTTSRWEQLSTFNASYSANISASSMLGITESMPRLKRLLLRTSYITKDALALFGRSNLFASIEEIDFSVGGKDSESASRGVEARRVEDCFRVRPATRLKVMKLRASSTRQSRKYDRKALKALKSMHGTHIKYVVDGF